MPSISDQLALRDRLQQIEHRLVRDHKRHILVPATHGIFVWALTGEDRTPVEWIEMPEMQAIEETLIAQGWSDLLVSTAMGYFAWEPKQRPAKKRKSPA